MKRLIIAILLIIFNLSMAESTNEVFIKSDKVEGENIEWNTWQLLEGHNSYVYSVSFSHDGKYLASGSADSTVKLWSVETGKEIKTLEEHKNYVKSIMFSSNSKYLVSGSWDKTIKLWDIETGKEIKTLEGHKESINSVVFSPDGKYLASGSADSTVKLWSVETGKEIKTLEGHKESINSVVFSPDGKYLASGSADSTVKLWSVETGKEIKTLEGHKESINSVVFSPDGKYLASGSADSTVKLWDIETGREIKTLEGHKESINSVVFSPNGKYLASGSWDGTIKLWKILTYKNVRTLEGQENGISSLVFDDSGKYLASGSWDKTIKLWKWNKINYFSYSEISASKKFKISKKTNIFNEDGNIIGVLPKNIILEIDKNSGKIIKSKGSISLNDIEPMYINNKDTSFYTLNNTPIFSDVEQTKVITNIEVGKKINTLYYSKDLNMVYMEDGNLKGWLNMDNIGILKNQYNKVVVINNNTNTYKVIDGIMNSSYNSGDILEFDKVADDTGYYYSDKIGWVNTNDVIVIDESDKNNRIFVNMKETKFNNDFTGYNYKNVPIGTEYVLLGTTDKYNLVSSKLAGEKGWILKSDMSFKKPDLNDPVILITNTSVDEDNMLTISGKIYDDTAIGSFLLNNNEMSIEPLNTFDKLRYVPEVGYSFTSQWFLIEGMENNVEIKVIDRDGKSYSKVLKYTPELESINLNDFQIENVVKKLPKLEYATELKDSNGDNILTGSEKMALTIKITNSGEGEAKNVTINLNNNSNNNLNYKNSYILGTIQSNETKVAVIDISGQDNIANGKALFDLQVNEQNGFNPFPAKLSFNVEPKLNPNLEIIDYAIDDENKNGQIEQGEKFDLYVLVQNTGEGDSKNTILELIKKADVIIPMDETSYKYAVLKSGESKKVKFSFVTNYLYKGNGDLPFDINLYNEKDFIKTQKPIILTLNKVMPTIKEINLEAKKKEIVVASKISIMSDIDDTSKLVTKESNPKKWAVVVGVENYKNAPDVEFAERDALVTREYFNKLLGVPKENIFYISNIDATYGGLKVLLKDKLKNRVAKDDEVYFYFSGHGVPTNEGDSYLLLNDSDPSNPKISAYPVKELYEDLGSLKTTKSYAFLDTCFSGGVARGDEKDSLLGGTRAVMKVNDVALSYNNLTVYAATGKDQLSNSFKEQNHGLFTYYMLKGLNGEADTNNDKAIGEQELQDYIRLNVTDKSSKLYGQSRYQEPMLKSNGVETIIFGK